MHLQSQILVSKLELHTIMKHFHLCSSDFVAPAAQQIVEIVLHLCYCVPDNLEVTEEELDGGASTQRFIKLKLY